jgi:hypothetical protein
VRRALVVLLLAAVGCHRGCSSSSSAPQSPAGSRESAPPVVLRSADPVKQAALADVQRDLVAARAAIAGQRNPIYACDRLALAAQQLSEEKDDGIAKLLADAETVYGLQGPVAWADAKLDDVEREPANKIPDCNTVRDMLNRVTAKFKEDSQVIDVMKRFKALCPKMKQPGASRRASSGPSPSEIMDQQRRAMRSDCIQRCDHASFDCNSRCSTCYGCSATWDECNRLCHSCKQGCEQNERFCRSSCGD